jgi:hypothetical protein
MDLRWNGVRRPRLSRATFASPAGLVFVAFADL